MPDAEAVWQVVAAVCRVVGVLFGVANAQVHVAPGAHEARSPACAYLLAVGPGPNQGRTAAHFAVADDGLAVFAHAHREVRGHELGLLHGGPAQLPCELLSEVPARGLVRRHEVLVVEPIDEGCVRSDGPDYNT